MTKMMTLEEKVEQFQMLESRNSQQGQENNPQNASQGGHQQPFGNATPMDISDDDLPF